MALERARNPNDGGSDAEIDLPDILIAGQLTGAARWHRKSAP
jgi:hypothetical protein